MNLLRTIALGVAVTLISKSVAKGMSLKNSSERLSTKLKNIRNIGKTGNGLFGNLVFDTDLELSNPSAEQYNIKVFSVKAFYNNAEIANTVPATASVNIPSFSAGTLSVSFSIPFQKLISSGLALDLIKNVANMKSLVTRFTYMAVVDINGVTVQLQTLIDETT